MTSEVISKAAPSNGWNTVDALASMNPNDAVIIDNWFPGTTGCTTRKGYRRWTTGGMGGGVVKTLFTYAGVASQKLFGFANNKIYDCSTFNASASDVTAGSAITSNRWQGVTFGGYAIMVNGADVPRKYDGATWTDAVYSGATGSTLIQVTAYRSRLYFVQTGTLIYWYGATNAVTGALTSVDLSTVFQRGGYLVCVATWTRDSGNGPDDFFVAISSTGEYVIYQGPDPSAASWTLVGRFRMGAPVATRCFATVGPELVVACQDGIVPLSKALTRGMVDNGANSAISAKIQPTFTQATVNYGANFGWELLLHPDGNYLLVNIPVQNSGVNVTSHQYVVNTVTGGWCRFIGQNAICWALFNNQPFFGTAVGTVMEANEGYSDGATGTSTTNGATITYDIKPAFDSFGARGQLKQFHMIKPYIQANGPITATLDVQVDFQDEAVTASVSSGGAGTPWGSPWGSPWGDSQRYTNEWFGVGALGSWGTPRLKLMSKTQQFTFAAYDMMIERGGFV